MAALLPFARAYSTRLFWRPSGATLATRAVRCPILNLFHGHRPARRIENAGDGEGHPRERRTMTRHLTGTREEWRAARLDLLQAEKELTRRSDELARQRQELPWVRVDKEYRFDTDEGGASLPDLFPGRSQLL